MKKLTNKEKEIMDLYWQHGPMFVRELQEHYADPKPHFNTLSTGRSSLAGIIRNYFGNSYLSAVSSFVKEEKVSVDELRELLEKIEKEK